MILFIKESYRTIMIEHNQQKKLKYQNDEVRSLMKRYITENIT